MTGVEFGVSTFVWYSPLTDQSLAEIAPRIAGWGFDAIEIPLERVHDVTPEPAAELLHDLGLKPVVGAVMPPGRDLVHTSAETVRETQAYLRACVDVAAAIGSSIVTGPIYAAVGRTWRLTRDERKAAIVELRRNLEPVVAHAAEKHVRFGLEPLNRYETSLVNTAEQACEIVEPLAPEGIGVTLDTYHMNIEEKSSADAIKLAGERLVYFQVCANDRGAPGNDQIDWEAVGRALVGMKYEGMASIESFTSQNATIATAASIWRALGTSQDSIARDGLAFLEKWRAHHWRAPTAPTASLAAER